MSSTNHNVILTPKQAREYRLQVSDLTSASEQPEINRSRYARTCDLVNATRKPQSDLDVLDFYSRRYTGLPYAQPTTPYTATEATADILAAGIPAWMVTVITRKANLSSDYRATVQAEIAAYIALEAVKRERNAAKLAQIMAVAL